MHFRCVPKCAGQYAVLRLEDSAAKDFSNAWRGNVSSYTRLSISDLDGCTSDAVIEFSLKKSPRLCNHGHGPQEDTKVGAKEREGRGGKVISCLPWSHDY